MNNSAFEEFLEDVVRACVDCDKMVSMPRIERRCEVCKKVHDDKRVPAQKKAALEDQMQVWRKQGIPTRFMSHVLPPVHEWALKNSVMIYGDVGTGKSSLAAMLIKKTGGKFITASAMIDDVMEESYRMKFYKDHRSLCMDDFTKINPTGSRLEKLFEIFNDRYSNDRHTIITCDTLASEIKDDWGKPGEAIVSRIGEWMKKIKMEEKFR